MGARRSNSFGHRPDVTLMDLQMPEMNGIDALVAIRAESPDAKIVVLTTYAGDVQILRALQIRDFFRRAQSNLPAGLVLASH
jgi:CheY-like chemotaxis protein